MDNFNLSTFELISVNNWCDKVRHISEMCPPKKKNVVYHLFDTEVQHIQPPDFFGDETDIEGIEKPEQIFGYKATAGGFEIGEVFLAYLENVSVKNNASIFLSLFVDDNLALAESVYNKWVWDGFFKIGAVSHALVKSLNLAVETPDGRQEVPVKVHLNVPPDITVEEPCVLLGNNPNYFHWTLEALSRLWCFDVIPGLRDLPIILPANPPRHILEMLEALNLNTNQFIYLNGRVINFKKLYFPSYLAGGGISARQISFVRDKLLSAFGFKGNRKGNKRYFLQRSDARVRRILNDEEVMAFLEQFGFESICPGKLTVRQQVEKFSQAEIVVSPHGAGNINFIYAPENATLIELMPKSSKHPLFWMVAKLAGQRYGRLICDDENGTQDMTVDMNKFTNVMQQVLQSC